MNDDELHDRLRSLGEHPVDETTRHHHLGRIAALDGATAPRRRRFGPLAVASAGIVGFLAGSTGLAMAGALPGDAQGVAHDVLGVVQLDVPEGKDGKRGPCVSEAAKIDDPDEKQAAKDACPKGPLDDEDAPGTSGDAPGKSDEAPGQSGDVPGKSDEAPGQEKHADDPCSGKPPWTGPMSKAEREALKEEFSRSDCVDDQTDGDADDGG